MTSLGVVRKLLLCRSYFHESLLIVGRFLYFPFTDLCIEIYTYTRWFACCMHTTFVLTYSVCLEFCFPFVLLGFCSANTFRAYSGDNGSAFFVTIMHISGRKTPLAAGAPLFSCVLPPRPCSAHTLARRFLFNFLFPSLDFPCTQAKHSALFWLQWHSWCSFLLFPCFRLGAAPRSIVDWTCVSSPVFYSLWLTSLGISAPLRLRFFSSTLVLLARRRMRSPRCGGGVASCLYQTQY